MTGRNVNILGAQYHIASTREALDDRLKDCDGFTDWTNKRIGIRDEFELEGNLYDMQVYVRKVVRHEIIHAFLEESGLGECSDWARNEEVIDWIARMGEKLCKAWLEAGALELQSMGYRVLGNTDGEEAASDG